MTTDAMSSRERLLSALKRQPVDRVPIRVWGVHPECKTVHPSFDPILQAGLDKTDLWVFWSIPSGTFLSGTDQVRVHTEVRDCTIDEYQEHVHVYETPAGTLTSSTYVNPNGKPGYVHKHLIETVEDAKRFLSVPYVPVRGDTSGFHEECRKLGDRGIVMVTYGEPMYAVNAMMGSETFALWSIEHRDLLREMIDALYERIRDQLEYYLEQGLGPVYGYVGPELCIPPLQSPADFQEFVVAYDRKLSGLVHAHDGTVWCHCHGKVGVVLEDFVRMGLDATHPVEPPPMGDVTLAEAKARVGHRMALEGNIEQDELHRATPSRVRQLVRNAIRDAAPGYGFILSSTSAFQEWSEASGQYVTNYLAFIDEGLQAGRYPIAV